MIPFKKPKFGYPFTVRDVKNLNDLVEKMDETIKIINTQAEKIVELEARIEALETP